MSTCLYNYCGVAIVVSWIIVLVSFLRRKPLERAEAVRGWALFQLGAGAEGEAVP
jgi:hypothetical protein